MLVENNYSVFEKSNGALLKSAFLIAPGLVELRLDVEIGFNLEDLILLEYDYENRDENRKHFLTKNPINPHLEKKSNDVFHLEIPNFEESKNYVIKYNLEQINVYLDSSIGGILDTFFDAFEVGGFGARIYESEVHFKVWSPPAAKIEVILYDENQIAIEPENPLWMKKANNGVWSLSISPEVLKIPRSLDGLFYQYRVFAYGKEQLALDPYAFSMAAFSPYGDDLVGKGAIVDMQSPKAKSKQTNSVFRNSDIMANENDLIAYEAHIRDFTIQPGAVEDLKSGTFSGFSEKIYHLSNLGITHVQFLPVMNFFSVDETKQKYQEKDAIESNYNWGYDAHHYFALEGWFSSNPHDPYLRIQEFRDLVQDLHENNIGVILDVVYNHVFSVATFENIASGCYFRFADDLTISKATGAGPSMESRRKMVRKLMLESLSFFVKEYKVDGFRFDLMSFHDHEIMRMIRSEVGKEYNPENINELILQGEAWVFSDLDTNIQAQGDNAATTKINFPKENLNLGLFNDVGRDAISGRNEHPGFVQGMMEEKGRVASAVVGGIKGFKTANSEILKYRFEDGYNLFAEYPNNCVNFLSIHDGLTLWDKINLSWGDETGKIRARLMKQVNVLLFTSQGKIILHGGDEILRTKPLANNDRERSRAISTYSANQEENTVYFQENSYSSPDYTNMFRWDRLHNQYAPLARAMRDYYKGLIEIRRSIPALRMVDANNIRQGIVFLGDPILEMDAPNYYKSVENENGEFVIDFPKIDVSLTKVPEMSLHILGYFIDNSLETDTKKTPNGIKEVLVIHNVSSQEQKVSVRKIQNAEEWKVICDAHSAGMEKMKYQDGKVGKGLTDVQVSQGMIVVPAHTSAILIRE